MRIKAVNYLKGGEILAEPVLTEKKEILIPKGTELKKDYIPLIQTLGIESLMIEDPYELFESPHPILSSATMETIVARIRKLMEGHIYHTENRSMREFEIIANDIVKEIVQIKDEDIIIDIKERNANLYEHTVMVTLLSLMVAKRMKLDKTKMYNIAIGCLLHDIGIRYITVSYENRDFQMADQAEIFEFKKHTILGYSALEEEVWIPAISRKMILAHHENLNGTGFPMKQKYKEIECKIIQACDAFDCYISGMECKRLSVQDALQKMSEEADVLFDKKIIGHLVSMVARYPVGTTVKTNIETDGVVIAQTVDPENPIIMILDNEIDSDKEMNKMNLMLEKDISILQVV